VFVFTPAVNDALTGWDVDAVAVAFALSLATRLGEDEDLVANPLAARPIPHGRRMGTPVRTLLENLIRQHRVLSELVQRYLEISLSQTQPIALGFRLHQCVSKGRLRSAGHFAG
jgi:hypothetical protein